MERIRFLKVTWWTTLAPDLRYFPCFQLVFEIVRLDFRFCDSAPRLANLCLKAAVWWNFYNLINTQLVCAKNLFSYNKSSLNNIKTS